MASYRFSVSTIGRKAGRSAVACAAYRSGQKLDDYRYGETHDYARKNGVLFSEILAPDHAPDWAHDRTKLWNLVEAAEKRADARLAREVQLSLPHELSLAENVALVREFVQEHFVAMGMVADVNIHAPHKQGDQRNVHAHVMLTDREIIDGDFAAKKNRAWNAKANVEQWREAWALHQNRVLEAHGHDARVDHRSLEDQGIDRAPQMHQGHEVTAMMRRGEDSRIANDNRAVDDSNSELSRLLYELDRVNDDILRERTRFAEWKEAQRNAAQDRYLDAKVQLHDKHDRQNRAEQKALREAYGGRWKIYKGEVAKYEARLNTKGVRALLRRMFGQQERDLLAKKNAQASLDNLQQRVGERKNALKRQQEAERAVLEQKRGMETEFLEKRLDRATERKEKELDQKRTTKERRIKKTYNLSAEERARLDAIRKQDAQRPPRDNANDRTRKR